MEVGAGHAVHRAEPARVDCLDEAESVHGASGSDLGHAPSWRRSGAGCPPNPGLRRKVMVSSGAVTAIDPLVYVRSIQPFQALPQPLFDELARSLEIAFFPAGTRLVDAGGQPLAPPVRHPQGGGPARARRADAPGPRGGGDLRLHLAPHGRGDARRHGRGGPARLPDARRRRSAGSSPTRSFAGHFALGLAERLRASLDQLAGRRASSPDLSGDVSRSSLRRPPVWVEPTTTVGEAARRDARRADLLGPRPRASRPAIVTDRDFRNRVLADGPRPGRRRWSAVAHQAAPDRRRRRRPLYDAWATLLDAGVHHLPVTRGDGDRRRAHLAATSSGATAQGPVAVLRGVERLPGRDSLARLRRARSPRWSRRSLAGGLEATTIAGFVARLNDALLRRILRWAEAELGPPPAPYAWIVFGSEGRMEQTLLTDQDNALVYADEGGGARASGSSALAERVERRPGDGRASRAAPAATWRANWHGPLGEWSQRFAGLDRRAPTPKALLEASIFFDFRRVARRRSIPRAARRRSSTRAAERPPSCGFLAQVAPSTSSPPPACSCCGCAGESSAWT